MSTTIPKPKHSPLPTWAPSLPRVQLRLFADPASRKTGGGAKLDIACTPEASGSGCSGALPRMPSKWSGRVSALALLYNTPSYALPGKKA